MPPKKKESEGIALLSIYGDEDDEMDDYLDDESDEDEDQIQNDAENELGEDDDMRIAGSDSGKSASPSPLPQQQRRNRRVGVDNLTPGKISNFGGSATTTPHLSFASPPQWQQQGVASEAAVSRSRLTIVDYAHDEVAMSPEAEEGEIMISGQSQDAEELQTVNAESQVKSPPGTLRGHTPSVQTPQTQSLETSADEAEDVDMVPAEEKEEDTLDKFLPPPPKAKCSDELQEKIIRFLALKKTTGRSFNAEVRNRKDYRNPDFLRHAVQYQGIDEIGSCFSTDVFDPHGYDKCDFYDEIEADMRREMERKEQERRNSQKVDFISGGTQPGAVTMQKPNLPIPGLVAGSGLSAAPTSVDAIPRDSRQNKKSKWDKVDVDRRDTISAVGAHAALLSAANAGSGYAAFAQQKRKEAEEKRSSDKKLDRRS
nr:SAP30-binding protein [Ipomoea batatas]